jgi:hypothetical protein
LASRMIGQPADLKMILALEAADDNDLKRLRAVLEEMDKRGDRYDPKLSRPCSSTKYSGNAPAPNGLELCRARLGASNSSIALRLRISALAPYKPFGWCIRHSRLKAGFRML